MPDKKSAARIVIVTYGSLGDLHPSLALARGLQARGHDAAVATSEPYRERVTRAGVAFRPVRPDLSLSDEALVRRVMAGHAGSRYLVQELVLPRVREMHDDIAALAADADVMITGELVYVARTIAERQRKRWAYLALSPVSFLPVHDYSLLPGPRGLHLLQTLGPGANRLVQRLARLVSYSWWQPLRALRREFGLPPGPSPLFAGKFSPQLNLAAFSSALQPAQAEWPSPTVQTGFLFHDELETSAQLPPALEAFLAAGEAPLVFTLGSAAVSVARDFYAESAQAAQRLGRRAVLLLGKNPPPANLPPTIFAQDYVPYARLFARAAAIVHQGGVGTTGQALRSGRPMLVVPFAHDQFDNAARVTRLGLGRRLPRERYNAATAARELRTLLGDAALVARAAATGAQVQTERGVDAACVAIERLLQRPPAAATA